MPKLSEKDSFFDVSDYGRKAGRVIAERLKNTSFTPLKVTYLFTLAGLAAVVSIIYGQPVMAFGLLLLKSVLDAADGELARVKNTPSYIGRYADSISDILLNLLILLAIGQQYKTPIYYTGLAFLALQLQGTFYNFYYVIVRNRNNGDTTSNIFENKTPRAFKGESQRAVNIIFKTYRLLYGIFDSLVYQIDGRAVQGRYFPKWFMTLVSFYGLGFQLFLIGFMLASGLGEYISLFLIAYTLLAIPMVIIRKYLLH